LYAHIYAIMPIFFQLTLAFMKLCHIKRDHLVNLYIEKREHFWYLCNSKTNLHKSLHDDAKRVSSVPGVKIKLLASFQLFNNYTARWHLFCAKDIVFSHNRYIKKQKFNKIDVHSVYVSKMQVVQNKFHLLKYLVQTYSNKFCLKIIIIVLDDLPNIIY